MLAAENYIVAAVVIDNDRTDFRVVWLRHMGVPQEWNLTPGNTSSEVRKAFQVFSQSALQISPSDVQAPL